MAEVISIAALKIQSPFEAPIRAASKWFRSKQTEKALTALSARELQDIGIERCDIEAIARRLG